MKDLKANDTATIDKIRANVKRGLLVKILGDELRPLIFSDTHRAAVLEMMRAFGANFIIDLDALDAASIYNLKYEFVEFTKLNGIKSEVINIDAI